jgi:ethanolamine utilization protein EutQ (cupin superfamily)
MTLEEQETLDTTLVKIQELVSSMETEQETLLLAAGMLSISRQIFEFYLGTDHADEIFEAHTGVHSEPEYSLH